MIVNTHRCGYRFHNMHQYKVLIPDAISERLECRKCIEIARRETYSNRPTAHIDTPVRLAPSKLVARRFALVNLIFRRSLLDMLVPEQHSST